MSRIKKLLIGIGAVLLSLIILFLLFIGPWPVYSGGFENTAYYRKDITAIDKALQGIQPTQTPGRLQAGWGSALLNPAPGLPMAGYGARQNIKEYLFGDKPTGLATGVHDDLKVKALALSDGTDCAVIVGADMLLVPPNVAEIVRREVAKQTTFSEKNIYFGASHTHDGPGAWGPGLAAFFTAGSYDPKIPEFLAAAFTQAILDAYKKMAPAKIAHGSIDAPGFIRNRARNAPVDSAMDYMAVEKEDGTRCVLVRYSAHPTNVGSKFLQMTAEYPGFLQSALEKAMPNTMVEYIGGSLGSSGPVSPEGPTDIDRAQAMGEALAKNFMDNLTLADQSWRTNVDIASVGVPLSFPSFQMRFAPGWRVSPLATKILGMPSTGWMQALRVGDVFMVGLPGDFSGEISLTWKAWAAEKGYACWPTSFCASYFGYISPDKYYNEPGAVKAYETGFMSWLGPHEEAFFTALMHRMFSGLTGLPVS